MVARIRTAYCIAYNTVEAINEKGEATEKAMTSTPVTAIDMEAAIPEEDKVTLREAWGKRYWISLSMFMVPADPLVNRLFREFRGDISNGDPRGE